MADEKRKRTGDRKRLQAGDEEGYGVVVSGDLSPTVRRNSATFVPSRQQYSAFRYRVMHIEEQPTRAALAEAAGVPLERVNLWFSSSRFVRWWESQLRDVVQCLGSETALALYREAMAGETAFDRIKGADAFLKHIAYAERETRSGGSLAGLFGDLRGAPAGTEVVLGVRVGGRPETSVSGHPDAVESPRTARVRVEGEGVPEISGKTPEPHSAPPPPAARISPPPSRPPRIRDE